METVVSSLREMMSKAGKPPYRCKEYLQIENVQTRRRSSKFTILCANVRWPSYMTNRGGRTASRQSAKYNMGCGYMDMCKAAIEPSEPGVWRDDEANGTIQDDMHDCIWPSQHFTKRPRVRHVSNSRSHAFIHVVRNEKELQI